MPMTVAKTKIINRIVFVVVKIDIIWTGNILKLTFEARESLIHTIHGGSGDANEENFFKGKDVS